ncbi:hypothetical protein BAE44_0011512 [Dichanthelium oligosanthes]|uniref:DUF6598 domain-containing protein n=1 Tax=Dichanthelium oligosanthes TaxID=888268 RepID=A0A1E5VQS8_9POAL|nr:hypothetical protein BAE44_0011512 [Dichanthelium oligosanthes]
MVTPDPPASRVFRLPPGPGNMATISRVKDDAVKHTGSKEEDGRTAAEDHKGKIAASDDEEEVSNDEGYYTVGNILAKSRHRDGSMYTGMDDTWWKKEYRIADRTETRLEAMAFPDPTDCIIHHGVCMQHISTCMLQILSLELAGVPADRGSVELYGYVAARDDLDPLLNYVVNVSRDEPIVVELGSLIDMAGPK